MTALGDARGRIAEVLAAHAELEYRSIKSTWAWRCDCDHSFGDVAWSEALEQAWNAHVAAVVLDALELNEEHATHPEWYDSGKPFAEAAMAGNWCCPPPGHGRHLENGNYSDLRFVDKTRLVSPWVLDTATKEDK